MKKRILIFALSYYPKPVGGAEVAIREITNRMDTDEFEFHLITNQFDSLVPKTEQVDNVLVHRIGLTKKNAQEDEMRSFPLHFNKILYQFTAYRYARNLHKKYNYTGIWALQHFLAEQAKQGFNATEKLIQLHSDLNTLSDISFILKSAEPGYITTGLLLLDLILWDPPRFPLGRQMGTSVFS